MTKTQPASFLQNISALGRSIWWNTSLFTFLVEASDNNGQSCLIHAQIRKSSEQPTHVHSPEDVTFYVLDGEIAFYSGQEKCVATAGEVVSLPGNAAHCFSLVTKTARALLLITPAGFESFFKGFCIPELAWN